tara:strand:- start:1265 stop:2635 length:1371 start_codon:yes stop_codon:yes gene_type:complete
MALGLEQDLVNFTDKLRFNDLPPNAILASKMRLLDSVGVAIAAFEAKPSKIARSLACEVTGQEVAQIWGTGKLAPLEDVAFANGVMVRYLDLNDAWRTKDAHHPSDYLPAILAVAESLALSGKDFITALATAYEIMCRFTDNVPFNDAGWDQPVTGSIATALAAGKLMGLEREKLMHSIALAIIPNLSTYQTRAGELSMWKGCAGPNGARNGVFAARLAREGMSGPFNAFEGIFGVWNQTLSGKKFDINLPDFTSPWDWGIEQTNIKTHAVRDSCQLPIFTAIDLKEKLNGKKITSLKIETYKSAWEGAVKDPELWAPKTRETADHSMLFSVACALADGKVVPDSFEEKRFLDADIIDIIKQCEVNVLDEFSNATPQRRNCRIIATTEDGERITAHRIVTLEEIKRGMPKEQVIAKFKENTERYYSPEQQNDIINKVMDIDQNQNLQSFSENFRFN